MHLRAFCGVNETIISAAELYGAHVSCNSVRSEWQPPPRSLCYHSLSPHRRAKAVRAERTAGHDEKRRRMMADLERREKGWEAARTQVGCPLCLSCMPVAREFGCWQGCW